MAGASDFQTTHWSLVLHAGNCEASGTDTALESLCEAYWFPLYAYARRLTRDSSEAQDLTQSFFEYILEGNLLSRADPERGRFRGFLLAAFRHFRSHQCERATAQKRGGGRRRLSLDYIGADGELGLEPSTELTAEQLYQRQWAITLLDRVMGRLRDEMIGKGKERQFNHLKELLVVENHGERVREASSALQMSLPAVRTATSRLRRRYRQLLRDEIAQTVARPEDVDDEIRQLFQALGD